MPTLRSLSLAFLLTIGLSGCQNPAWNFDNFQVAGEFRLDGTCSVSLDGKVLGEGTYTDFMSHFGLPDEPAGSDAAHMGSCAFGEMETLTFFVGHRSFRAGASGALITEGGWPHKGSTASLKYSGFDGSIEVKSGTFSITAVEGDKMQGTLQYSGKRHYNYF